MKSKRRYHREFTRQSMGVAVSLLFVASVFVFALLSTPSITGGVTVQSIALLKAGQPFDMAVKNVRGVQQATFKFEGTAKDLIVTIEDKTGKFPGTAYSQFEIRFSKTTFIDSILLRLKIKEQDLRNAGLNPEEVRLYLDSTELPTTLIQRKDDYVYYTATTTEIGLFTIGRKIEIKTMAPPVEEVPAVTKPVVPVPEPIAEEPRSVVGGAVQQPAEPRLSLWARIVLFVRGLFR